MGVKLTREMELQLIEIGLRHLLAKDRRVAIAMKPKPVVKRPWSKAQRAKFMATMAKKAK